ncbi:hypothetical protein [Candidatus Laterigemmans baculatus]|nr:hypothetical protein [Candidatus Laterigemmans baculatus]
MIRCIPKGLCSWNYRLHAGGHSARIEINWTSEQGALEIDGERYEIQKHGPLSGHWTLTAGSKQLASAKKISAFTRTIELDTESGTVTLSAESAFGRTMLLAGAGFDAVIAPAHPFTRRASITGTIGDFRTVCFAFWLTVLLWRRAAQSSHS